MIKTVLNTAYPFLATLVLPNLALAGSCICLACLFDPKLENFRASGESMTPKIDTGECALMRHIDSSNEPIKRVDVIGFKLPPNKPIFVFRVIAKAGDTIGLRGGQVVLNGWPISQTFKRNGEIVFSSVSPFPQCKNTVESDDVCKRTVFTESLSDDVSYEIFDAGVSSIDETAEVIVPRGHVF